MNNPDDINFVALWEEFQRVWPIDRIKSMKLSEYTGVGDINTFTYWIESRLSDMGSVWGGSSFKFGVFARKAKESKVNGEGKSYSDDYAWYSKYGNNVEDAFIKVRGLIVQIAEAAAIGNIGVIDDIDLGPAYKWKIAFHYQPKNSPCVLSVFRVQPLAHLLGIKDIRKLKMSDLYHDAIKSKPADLGLVNFSKMVYLDWRKSVAGDELNIKLTQGAIDNGYLSFNKNDSIFPEETYGDQSGSVLGELITLNVEDFDPIETDIRAGAGNTLRIRARFGALFNFMRVVVGDTIRISKISESEYQFEHIPVGENLAETKIANTQNKSSNKKDTSLKSSINTIMYGPPGTGKTFNTTNLALKIIGEEGVDDQLREKLKQIFDTKMQEQQIFFTTFHQSMSYEDFIEGIKPVEPKQDGHSVNYKIIDGIFKRACAVAAYNCYKLFNSTKTQQRNYSFDDLYSAFINSINEQIVAGSFPVYKSIKGKDIEVKYINGNDSVIARAKNSVSNKSAPLTKENLQKLYDAFDSVDEIEELQQIKDIVQIIPRISEFYAVFKGLKEFERTYKVDDELISEVGDLADIDFEEIQKKFNERVFNKAIEEHGNDADPVVIIIDEINRGNVSQIFGELITLIEEDKRLGKDEAVEVTLPYSKKLFGVPPNLYIIGTMNTADRSVEALDAALRRRFNFVEMLPDPNLIKTKGVLKNSLGFLKEIDLPDLLNVINSRIEKLIDKDHQIGHSYFMSIATINDLKVAFKNKIIPLLQEYFFGDYGKIGLVLGKGFVETSETLNDSIFADFDSEYASDFSERVIYKIKNIDQMEDQDFFAAINLLLKK